MKSTGIIRRVDELGRIVIPKEIRKNLRLRVGDNIEIFIENDMIILKKFSMMNKISDLAQELTDSIFSFMKNNIIITDQDCIIACSGELKKILLNKHISETIKDKIEKRERTLDSCFQEISITNDLTYNISYACIPIIKDSQSIGLFMIFSKTEKMSINHLHLLEIVSSFITKYLEE